MRERERRKLIEKTDGVEHSSSGEPLYFRPYRADCKTITEIARSTGEKKSAVAQKLVHIALSGNHVQFGENRTEEKLDWLIKNERHRAAKNDTLEARLDRLEEHGKEMFEMLSEIANTSRETVILASELFCMTNVCVSYLNQLFTKVLEFLSPVEIERSNAVDVANRNILTLIEHSLADLEKCANHYEMDLDHLPSETLYLSTKIDKIRMRLAASETEAKTGKVIG